MKHIRLRIIDLIDQHRGSYDKCPGCAACTEIEKLRKVLDREPEDKFKHILDKGQDMTKSDIAFLLENEVRQKVIRKTLKMDRTGFYNMMTNLGFTKRRQQKEELKVGKLKMTIEEFVDLKYKQNLSFVQIAKLKGVSDPTIHHWKDRHKDKIKKALLALNLPQDEEKKPKLANPSPEVKKAVKSEIKAPEPKPIGKAINEALNEAFAEKTAEYERLVAALRNDLNDAHKQLDEKDEHLRNLEQAHVTYVGKAKEEQERLNGQVQEVEKELGRVMDDAYETERKLQESVRIYRVQLENAEKQLEELKDEYQTLRWLVKKWA